jgi:hypothetical protein
MVDSIWDVGHAWWCRTCKFSPVAQIVSYTQKGLLCGYTVYILGSFGYLLFHCCSACCGWFLYLWDEVAGITGRRIMDLETNVSCFLVPITRFCGVGDVYRVQYWSTLLIARISDRCTRKPYIY